MKNKIYAISLLLSFLVVLSHEMIFHHHHDTLAYDFTTSHEKVDEHKHGSNDKHDPHPDSHEEKNSQKDTDNEHNHPFPLHQHVSASNEFEFTRTNIQESNISIDSIKTITVLYLFTRKPSEPPSLTQYSFGDPPFLINSLFEPGAIALRGPPSFV